MSREVPPSAIRRPVAVTAAFSGAAVWSGRLAFPGWWPFATFSVCRDYAGGSQYPAAIAAKGSTSFIMHMASALLFGGWWGAVVAALSTLFGELSRGNPPIKIVFNVAQRMLAVSLAAIAYHQLGGALPPAYLAHRQVLRPQSGAAGFGPVLHFCLRVLRCQLRCGEYRNCAEFGASV